MTVQTSFFNWASSGLPYDRAPWEQCSPNLVELLAYLLDRWGGYSLGCEGDRTIRDGTAISSHAYGAALDWRYTPVPAGARNVARAIALDEVLPFVIDHSAELHIDAIHDYAGDRIWRAGRTSDVADAHTTWWKTQNGVGSGMGESWATYFHLETNFDGWADTTPIPDRLTPAPPPGDDDMPLTDDDVQRIAKAVWDHAMVDPPTQKPATTGKILGWARHSAANADRQTRPPAS